MFFVSDEVGMHCALCFGIQHFPKREIINNDGDVDDTYLKFDGSWKDSNDDNNFYIHVE